MYVQYLGIIFLKKKLSPVPVSNTMIGLTLRGQIFSDAKLAAKILKGNKIAGSYKNAPIAAKF